MVRTFAPSSCNASTVQDFIALPLTLTSQAPHCEVSQPTCVPVSRRFSRSNCTNSVRGSTSAVTGLPFTVRDTAAIGSSSNSKVGSNVANLASAGAASAIQGRNRGDFAGSPPQDEKYSEPQPARRSREFRVRRGSAYRGRAASLFALRTDRRGEILEKIVGDLFGGAIDQPLAELRQLTADLRLDRVGQ